MSRWSSSSLIWWCLTLTHPPSHTLEHFLLHSTSAWLNTQTGESVNKWWPSRADVQFPFMSPINCFSFLFSYFTLILPPFSLPIRRKEALVLSVCLSVSACYPKSSDLLFFKHDTGNNNNLSKRLNIKVTRSIFFSSLSSPKVTLGSSKRGWLCYWEQSPADVCTFVNSISSEATNPVFIRLPMKYPGTILYKFLHIESIRRKILVTTIIYRQLTRWST